MNDKLRSGMFVEYIGPSREGLKHGQNKLINDADEFGIRLVGVRGYFDPLDFNIAIPAFFQLKEEEKGVLLQAMLSGKTIQVKEQSGLWKDIVFKNLIVFNKKLTYREKPKELDSLDKIYHRRATAQKMLLDAERDLDLMKKAIKNA